MIFRSKVCDLVYKVWQCLVQLTEQRKEEHNSKLYVWVVSSSCSWNCMFGQWALLPYIVIQLLIGLAKLLIWLESPNRDTKSPNSDSYVLNVFIDSYQVHPLTRNIYISISMWASFPPRFSLWSRVSLVNISSAIVYVHLILVVFYFGWVVKFFLRR